MCVTPHSRLPALSCHCTQKAHVVQISRRSTNVTCSGYITNEHRGADVQGSRAADVASVSRRNTLIGVAILPALMTQGVKPTNAETLTLEAVTPPVAAARAFSSRYACFAQSTAHALQRTQVVPNPPRVLGSKAGQGQNLTHSLLLSRILSCNSREASIVDVFERMNCSVVNIFDKTIVVSPYTWQGEGEGGRRGLAAPANHLHAIHLM